MNASVLSRTSATGTMLPAEATHTTMSVRRRAAYVLSAVAAALTIGAGLTGLLVDGAYGDVPAVTALARGSDAVAVVVGVPLLGLALVAAARGSVRAHLVWLGMLAYLVYDYAYFVYGATFNDLFVVHVAIFVASAFALGLALMDLDVTGVGARFGRRGPARWISGLLMLLGGSIIAMWVYRSVAFAVAGDEPTDVLPVPLDRVHLGYAIDLTLFGPIAVLAAVLLWRRTDWGYVLGAVVCLFAGVYQFNYLTARYLASGVVEGVSRYDWLGVVMAVALLGAAARLLGSRAMKAAP
jgi:hypothetical protein